MVGLISALEKSPGLTGEGAVLTILVVRRGIVTVGATDVIDVDIDVDADTDIVDTAFVVMSTAMVFVLESGKGVVSMPPTVSVCAVIGLVADVN
jgi:hypothetical protein